VHGEEQAAFVRSIADRIRSEIFDGVDVDELQRAIDVLERINANLVALEDVNVPA
jgi:MarR family transcriptional regulator for hemolysin